MPLDPLQMDIVAVLKSRRSQKSFVGGSSVFNEEFPRRSDDIDIYAEDAPISDIAGADVEALRAAGFHVDVDDQFYGFVIEATVARAPRDREATKLEWSEPDRQRFYPIQQNETFGWTLHRTDLAVQKLIAAATRRAARDPVDVLLIARNYAPLAALALAAPAKLQNVSPIAILERALRNAVGHPSEDYLALRIDRETAPFSIDEIKQTFMAEIDDAIDTITRECAGATPGLLYLTPGAEAPVIPRDQERPQLRSHAISARGTVPIFSS